MERITAEEVYREHYRHSAGEPDATPRVPFLMLSDMAIQNYEIEADLLNAIEEMRRNDGDSSGE